MTLAAPVDQRGLWLVAYDIVGDKRRAKVARRLGAVAHRVQKSVFVGRLTAPALGQLVEDLRRLIDLREDVVDFIPLCAACRDRSKRLGAGALETPRWTVI